MTKQQIRTQIRQCKDAAPAEELARQGRKVAEMLLADERIGQTDVVVAYWPMEKELDLREAILKFCADGKRVFLPVMLESNNLEFRCFDPVQSNLQQSSRFNVIEPLCGRLITAEETGRAVIIVPGIAFTKEGERLGRGKGFYDVALNSTFAGNYKIGVCFDFQVLPTLPTEPHDRRVDEVLHG